MPLHLNPCSGWHMVCTTEVSGKRDAQGGRSGAGSCCGVFWAPCSCHPLQKFSPCGAPLRLGSWGQTQYSCPDGLQTISEGSHCKHRHCYCVAYIYIYCTHNVAPRGLGLTDLPLRGENPSIPKVSKMDFTLQQTTYRPSIAPLGWITPVSRRGIL